MTDDLPLEVVNLDELDHDDAVVVEELRQEIVRDRATVELLEDYLRHRQASD